MRGIAKALLITIIVSICLLLFTNLIFFFPWYMTLVTETFSLSQVAASDNYVKDSYYEDTLKRLQDRPIFRDMKDGIKITALNEDGYSAIGNDKEAGYADLTDYEKPYRQRGKPVKVEIDAVYPLTITLWGKKIETDIPVSFSLTTTGLKHYKDLDYYFENGNQESLDSGT